MSSNEKKAATLGMPHGTATGRLKKNILFHLLKKHGENVCFKCSEVIDKVEDLSIEHKKPWEGISAELFWDIENIAFSHLHCNRPHRNPGPKIFTPDGTAWCYRCRSILDVLDFHKCASKDDGLQNLCKSCKAESDTRPNHAKKVIRVVD